MASRGWRCFQTPPPRPNLQANLVFNHTGQQLVEQEWHLNIGSTHNLTTNISNLNIRIRSDDFSSNDKIQIGDGTI